MRITALIVAAGRGTRAGPGAPKQYRTLLGRAILTRAAEVLLAHSAITEVRAVIHPEDGEAYAAAVSGLRLAPPVWGGPTRQDSVRLALEALATDPPDAVLIHDGARPLLSAALLDRVLAEVARGHAAIPALPVTDTLKRALDQTAIAGPSRDGLWRAQTPQAFPYAPLLAAHRAQAGGSATDDAAIAETAGLAVHLVQGEEENIKVTHANDLARAERLLLARLPDVRTGMGFDVHAFGDEPGRALMLCGIAVQHSRSLAGHSDADVGIHAAVDALLGAMGDGDIGRHFPPTDSRWRNADSAAFLRFAAERLAQRGGVLAHLDVTLICEAPKIAPHAATMQARVAEIMAIDPGRISVKATTTEKLGFTGRREGIAAQAIATIRLP
jgi:2-C-methyl-D-erythritol 4-phosphate cytidylyltransferase/2-C-methyl-D-erythritol 2,4-cyclodiphosphate synthase